MRTQVRLSQDLLDRLKVPKLKGKAASEVPGFRNAVFEVAQTVGTTSCRDSWGWGYGDEWNKTIDWLDENYPGWRGYPNPLTYRPDQGAAVHAIGRDGKKLSIS